MRGGALASAANVTQGASVPAPIGGWDAISPLADMPPDNAVELVNFFPQPGWVELRRGALIHANIASGEPVETLMAYMGQDASQDLLIAASAGKLYGVTDIGGVALWDEALWDSGATWYQFIGPTPSGSGAYGSDRWQFTNFANDAGSFLWMANGVDKPQYYDGTDIIVTNITAGVGSDAFTPEDIIAVTAYRERLWCVLKNTTKAVYLGLNAIDGDGFTFDVGPFFVNGGYLQAIGTWATNTLDGPNEFISFISSQGDVVIYVINDPTDDTQISLFGHSEISQPVGWRCLRRIGSDLGVITLDGVLPLSQVLTYDKAALIGKSITVNIRSVLTQVLRTTKDNFGWQLESYPRNTMAILNVPLIEETLQQQYVMNTITGAWAQFEGQLANCWEIFHDRAYFGDNAGIVWLADEAAGDEDRVLLGSISGAFNYYQQRGQLKRWHTIRPNITIDQTYPITPQIGLDVDFATDAQLSPVEFGADTSAALWDSAIWDQSIWPGELTSVAWAGISGLGYCASLRLTVSVPWDVSLISAKVLKFNGYDILHEPGAFI